MFSPIVAMAPEMASRTVPPLGAASARIASTSPPFFSATPATSRASAWKSALRATKSVSELTSTTTPFVPSTSTATRPSAATRPDFLAALVMPFLRSQSTAASTSPDVSLRAFLQSIMPAPVFSRRSFTIAAETVAMGSPFGSMRSAKQGPHGNDRFMTETAEKGGPRSGSGRST